MMKEVNWLQDLVVVWNYEFSNEFAKSVNGRTGIMELQPGQINWGTINAQPLPGAVRMWVWHTFALGDMFTCSYRFKQPLFGSEQTHKGIIDTDGDFIGQRRKGVCAGNQGDWQN
jgi:beta-galactosidase GanA